MPSADTQFKAGQSGNPGGRPKRRRLTDLLIARLDENGNAEAVVDAWIAAILAGDISALREALNRVEGRVPERFQVADDRNPPRINPRAPDEPKPEPEPRVIPIRSAHAV